MLWLYGNKDSFYSLKYIEQQFDAFHKAGGKGELFEVNHLPGDGHMLALFVDKWKDTATNYLGRLPGPKP